MNAGFGIIIYQCMCGALSFEVMRACAYDGTATHNLLLLVFNVKTPQRATEILLRKARRLQKAPCILLLLKKLFESL